MTRLARTAFFVAVLLPASVATVSAAEWVTWMHSVAPHRAVDTWRKTSEAQSLVDCESNAVSDARKAVTALGEAKRVFGGTVTRTGMIVEMTLDSGEKSSMEFVCLPGTVDPREPKGK